MVLDCSGWFRLLGWFLRFFRLLNVVFVVLDRFRLLEFCHVVLVVEVALVFHRRNRHVEIQRRVPFKYLCAFFARVKSACVGDASLYDKHFVIQKEDLVSLQ